MSKNKPQKRSVIVLMTAAISTQVRSVKEVGILTRGGYTVTAVDWDRQGVLTKESAEATKTQYREISLPIRAPYSNSLKVLAYWPVWWAFTLYWLLRLDVDVIHAINVDTILPALIAATLRRKPLIYEQWDVYQDAVRMPGFLRRVFSFVDKIFMRLSDAVIIVDDARVTEMGGIPNRNVVTVYNSPPDYVQDIDGILHMNKGEFVLCHAGVLHKARQLNLDKIVLAIKDLDNVKLNIAGYGDQVEEIQEWCRQYPGKVNYLGRFRTDESPRLIAASHLVPILYDPAVPQNRFASPTKLFEAMMCGRPVLVSKDTSMVDIVEKENCGLVVNCRDVGEIREAILRLRDDRELYQKLSTSARRAYEEHYSWGSVEKCLLELYQQLLKR